MKLKLVIFLILCGCIVGMPAALGQADVSIKENISNPDLLDDEIDIIGKISEFLTNDPWKELSIPFENGGAQKFITFIAGLAGFAFFVWFFYRYISRRDLLPGLAKKEISGKINKPQLVMYSILYAISFPIIIFVWFALYTGLIFFLSDDDMPYNLIMFVSMSLIGVIRITSYFREDLAKDIGKTIPFAMLGIFLTQGDLFTNPNFVNEAAMKAVLIEFQNAIPGLILAIGVISIIEAILRATYMITAYIRPNKKKILGEDIEIGIEEKLDKHFKRIQEQEKHLEETIKEEQEKLESVKRELEKIEENVKSKK